MNEITTKKDEIKWLLLPEQILNAQQICSFEYCIYEHNNEGIKIIYTNGLERYLKTLKPIETWKALQKIFSPKE